MAALLTACGGELADESGSMPQKPLRLEDISQDISGQSGTTELSREMDEKTDQTGNAQGESVGCVYENGDTEKILDALKAHNAPATFFVAGHFLETEPELVKRMVEEGE